MALLPVRKRERRRGELQPYDEVRDFFRNFLEPWEMPRWGAERWPSLDISDVDNQFVVNAEVPGCKPEDIDISVTGNLLSITGEKKEEHEEEQKGRYHTERTYGSFRRDLTLPADVDPDKIEAKCKNGVLSLKMPKAEESKSKKVKVTEE